MFRVLSFDFNVFLIENYFKVLWTGLHGTLFEARHKH